MKVLVLGASGFVGSFLEGKLEADGASRSIYGRDPVIDVTSADGINAFFAKRRYGTVINCTGFTNVDGCEADPERADLLNAKSIEFLANAATSNGSKFIHISTDYVFDGRTGRYAETDKPNPINVYGKTKLRGESFLDMGRDLILRISTPFGQNVSRRKKTFLEFVRESLEAGQKIKVVTDQYTTPTSLEDIATFVKAAIKMDLSGIYHLGVQERVSRYEFAIAVAKRWGLDQKLIERSRLSDLKFAAQRPMDTSFNLYKAGRAIRISHLEDALARL